METNIKIKLETIITFGNMQAARNSSEIMDKCKQNKIRIGTNKSFDTQKRNFHCSWELLLISNLIIIN